MSRFDYVAYDSQSQEDQAEFKALAQKVESEIQALGMLEMNDRRGTDKQRASLGRNKALAITALEECYMWIGKSIRDVQLIRNTMTKLQEERNDG